MPAPTGALLSAHGCRGWYVRGEAVMAAPPFAHHSTMALCLCGGPGFLHEHSWLWSSLLPSPLAVFSHPTAVPSPGLLSKPHIPAPNPQPPATSRHLSQAEVHRAVAQSIPSCFLSSSFFLLSFVLPSYTGIFLVLLGV